MAISTLVSTVSSWTDYTPGVELTVNVGRISGGTTHNTIAGSAEALVEMRARDASVFAAALRRLRLFQRHLEGKQQGSNLDEESSAWLASFPNLDPRIAVNFEVHTVAGVAALLLLVL